MEKTAIAQIVQDLAAIATLRQEIQTLVSDLMQSLREAEEAENYERCVLIRDGLRRLVG